MHRQRKFTKKNTVRFHLVPGTDEKGNPTVIYQPAQMGKSKLTQKERKKIINQMSGYEIQIDGKIIDQSQIPTFVLEQIKGRANLIFNQKNPELFRGMEEMAEEVEEEAWDEEGQEIPQQQYMNAEQLQPLPKADQTPTKVQIDGKSYTLTPSQLKLLSQVLPQNYENYKIDGVDFRKYNEDGVDITNQKQLQLMKRYIANPVQKRAIVDSFEYKPEVPVDIIDNDMDGEVLKGDVKEVDDALEYEGEDGAYEEIEDDFFAKLISAETTTTKKQVKQTPSQQAFKKKKSQPLHQTTTKPQPQQKMPQKKQKPLSKLDILEGDEQYYQQQQYDQEDEYEDEDDYQDQQQNDAQQITDEMLDKALEQFNKRKEQGKIQENGDDVKRIPGTGVPVDKKGQQLCDFIQSREQCIGKDGQLDWRTLTKKQKKQYMKNKKIREIYDEVRQRQIAQKLKDKKNVTAQELHLKKYIKHIPYNEDHVMQQAIKRDQQTVVNLQEIKDNQQDYETDSQQDDIISYRAKTSIISSNLATVQETNEKRKKKKNKDQAVEDGKEEIKNVEKVKVVPERRNRKQTPEERKQRKQKLKEMKKQKKDQRKQFNEVFEGEKKKVIKRDNNANNPLYKVPYVKII